MLIAHHINYVREPVTNRAWNRNGKNLLQRAHGVRAKHASSCKQLGQFNLSRSSPDRRRTKLGTLRVRWIRAGRRMRLTPERIAKARVPAPETKRHSA